MISALTLGAMAGTLAGLFPGIGPFLAMLILFPIVSSWDALSILVCYATIMQVSQSVSTITTIYAGVAGETSSMPTIKELPHLNAEQRGLAIAQSAVGSAFAAITSVMLCWMLSQHLGSISYVFRTEVILVLFLIAIALVIKHSQGSKLESTALLMFGLLLGLIGYNNNLQMNVFTFGNMYLMQGLPMDVVFLCLFVIPQLYQLGNSKFDLVQVKPTFRLPKMNWLMTAQSSVIGFVGGLMPGLGTTFSSIASYSVRGRQTKDPMERIVATETANNAGAVAVLIPMLLFGLPMVAGEALTISIMEATGYTPGIQSAATYFGALAPWLLVSTVIALTLSWPLATRLLWLLRSNMSTVRYTILAIMSILMLQQAWQDYRMWYVLACTAVLLPIGWALRRKDTMGLVFGFLIAERLLDYLMRIFTLYS